MLKLLPVSVKCLWALARMALAFFLSLAVSRSYEEGGLGLQGRASWGLSMGGVYVTVTMCLQKRLWGRGYV